jgi:hypothetical protein
MSLNKKEEVKKYFFLLPFQENYITNVLVAAKDAHRINESIAYISASKGVHIEWHLITKSCVWIKGDRCAVDAAAAAIRALFWVNLKFLICIRFLYFFHFLLIFFPFIFDFSPFIDFFFNLIFPHFFPNNFEFFPIF